MSSWLPRMNSLVHWSNTAKATRLGSRAGRWRTRINSFPLSRKKSFYGCLSSSLALFYQRRGAVGIKNHFVIWKFGTPVCPHSFFKNTNLRKCRSNFCVLPFFGDLRFWRFAKPGEIQINYYGAAIRRLWITPWKEFWIIGDEWASYMYTAISLRVIDVGSSTSLHWR